MDASRYSFTDGLPSTTLPLRKPCTSVSVGSGEGIDKAMMPRGVLHVLTPGSGVVVLPYHRLDLTQ
eukprot:15444626-Alexandrium_andersonii.AAC.1